MDPAPSAAPIVSWYSNSRSCMRQKPSCLAAQRASSAGSGRVLMHTGEGKVDEHPANLARLDVAPLDLGEGFLREPLAVGTLEVGHLVHRHRRRGRALAAGRQRDVRPGRQGERAASGQQHAANEHYHEFLSTVVAAAQCGWRAGWCRRRPECSSTTESWGRRCPTLAHESTICPARG